MRVSNRKPGLVLVPMFALVLTAAWAAPAAWAQDAKLGRQKAQPCMVCHGTNGLSTQPDAPNLAGQPALYLRTQLKAYQSGERRHETMAMMAKTLSDEDVAHVAAWFSSIRIEAHVKP
ncbi:Cytochrome c4 [Rubrivivax sp. A210]|uniref:c-type cytochrome n=1 Tax=Rubrivivax sp. A210 TaxID=2772301 RepID=UPI00191A650E|nr:cytochrome c [Rubrivivax sp. A210]CAD5372041.1 Cytochrome c4 [Rubrivivax sp. A210]